VKLDKIKNIRDKSMGNQYFGDDLIPGVNVKNINAGIINPLNRFGSLLGTAYNQYGEGLRGALGQNQDDYAQQFLDGKLTGQKGLKDIVQITLKDGKEQSFDVSTKEGADAMNKAIDAQQPMKPASENPQPVTGGAKLDPNATKEFKTAFNIGEKKMDDMLNYFGSQNNGENLKTWAKANPALAYKEFKKAGMTAKEPFGYNDVEFGKLPKNPAVDAERAGIKKVYDNQVEQTDQEKLAQMFKNTAVGTMLGLDLSKYKDLEANPFQIDIPTLFGKSEDFNIPGLTSQLSQYSASDYRDLIGKNSNLFNYK